MMKILERKGYVEHRAEGRAFVYHSVVDRESAARAGAEPHPRRPAQRRRARRAAAHDRTRERRKLMDALLIAVFNALWQGAALIALVALALRAGLRRNATTACVVWSITFAVVALLPAIDIALARPASVRTPAPAPESIALAAAEPAAAVRAVRAAPVRPSVSDPVQLADRPYRVASAAAPVPAGDSLAVQFGGIATAFAHAWGIVLLVAWALVAGVLLLRLTLAYAAVGRMKRAATPLGDPVIEARLRAAGHRRRATVARSARVEIPCAIGFLRPMILI